ncbi:uncharacterized protein LOC110035969, partial [Phalaenopsis equestris]|uniref:uncharacterized protein LOC110035969 n=1 Tax=Phalaenopsis equestris TaxID=78828 RepID=UPI0009E55FCB
MCNTCTFSDYVFCSNLQSCEPTNVLNEPIAENFLSNTIHNEQEAYGSYCAYAHHVGFTVGKDHTRYWPNSKKLKTKDFVCGKAGYKKEPNIMDTVKFKKTDTGTRCLVMVRYVVDPEGKEQEASTSREVVNPCEANLTDCLTK